MNSSAKSTASSDSLPHKILVEAETVNLEPQALAFASRMAGPIGARLVGCFIENQALIDLSELPFASEVSAGGTVRRLDPERLIKEWQEQAKQAEAAFAAAAETAGLDWGFEVRRGKPLFSMLEAAKQKDVVVLNAAGRLTAASDVARAVRAATNEIHADVLLTGRAQQRRVSSSPEQSATLVVLDDMTSRGEACCRAAEHLASRSGMTCIPVRIESSDLHTVAELVRQLTPSLIIADSASALFSKDDDVTRFSLAAGCPILLLGAERTVANN